MNSKSAEMLAYTTEEARSQIPLGRNSFYEAVKRGDIPSVRIGKRILIPKKQFNAMFEVGNI
jgi:excisionase family DNA binding protein